MPLTRDQILQVPDLVTEEVSVPEWGGTVLVKTLTGAERDRLEATIVSMNGKKTTTNLKNLRAKMCVASCVDEEGKPLFTEKDVEALGNKSAAALQRVFEVGMRLSGLSEEDVDELTKN